VSHLRPILIPSLVLSLAATLAIAPAAQSKVRRDSVVATVTKKSQRGSTVLYTGTVRSKLFGRGTVTQTVRIQGLRASGSFVIRYRRGTIRGTTTAVGRPALNGTAKFTGTARITGGTGRYKGARGSGSYTGTSPLNLSRATFRQTGTVDY
jgi:hypothetical protein